MAYAAAGCIPEGDPYEIEGSERDLVKLGVNIMLNCSTRSRSMRALTEGIKDDPNLIHLLGIDMPWRTLTRPAAMALVTAIEEKHSQITDYFHSDCGVQFQKTDSDMAIEIMTTMIEKTGRCPLPLHDSFLVIEEDADLLHSVMDKVARDHGLAISIKRKDHCQ